MSRSLLLRQQLQQCSARQQRHQHSLLQPSSRRMARALFSRWVRTTFARLVAVSNHRCLLCDLQSEVRVCVLQMMRRCEDLWGHQRLQAVWLWSQRVSDCSDDAVSQESANSCFHVAHIPNGPRHLQATLC